MIKTVKVKKQMRLDELIKYAFDNDVKDTRFKSSNGSVIYFDEQGGFTLCEIFSVKKKSTFTIEEEEEITEDTRFKGVQEIYIDDEGLLQLEHHPIFARKSINDVLEEHDEETECLYIYAAVDGKTELIWEAE